MVIGKGIIVQLRVVHILFPWNLRWETIRKILDSKEGCFNNNKIIDTKNESHEILATIFTGGGTSVQSHLKCGEEGVFKK